MLNAIDLSRIDLNLLVLFEAVMAERHVGRAAAQLHLTPSAVSHGLNRLRVLLRDPVFLKHPRGVVPTERALSLAPRVSALLDGARSLVADATPFEPASAQRTFTLGAPDPVTAWLLPPLMQTLGREAPRVRLLLRQVLPHHALAALDGREIDVALTDAAGDVPPRFASRPGYADRWVVVVRTRHPFTRRPTLDRYCELEHVVVSAGGDPEGFADRLLAGMGRTRRVALAVPHFMLSLAVVARTNMAALVPEALLREHRRVFGVRAVPAPFEVPPIDMRLVLPRPALSDAGIDWLAGVLERHLSRPRVAATRRAAPEQT
ncbi:MAG TPA: LysR substrate-binding domain-containing protein [Steroidobacteraceae bacterium]|nr:LysR substrate-binding domain-containing protein [Steroidobacteraceae bacterium]